MTVAAQVRPIPWIEPVAAAGRLRSWGDLCFLDSAMRHDTLGRYSYVAAAPFGTLVVRDGAARWNGEALDAPPLRAISEALRRYGQADIAGLPPFQGGAIGYVAYEFGALLESVPATRPPDHGAVPDAELMFYDVVCAFDHREEKAWIISTGLPEEDDAGRAARARQRADAVEAALKRDRPEDRDRAPPPSIARAAFRSDFTAEGFRAAVRRVVDAVLAGDIFQANVAQRFTAALPERFDPWAFYRRLREVNAAPFCAFIERDGMAIASSSPERFLKVDGTAVETCPIKGTARRAADPAGDKALGEALQASEKDRAENIMIVDLLRNDLSRVCRPGTIGTPALCALETYAGVHHLVSVVTGELRPGCDVADLIGAAFPGGSVTGAPKIKAMEVIAGIEGVARGVYCGAIGYFGFNGRSDMSIAIRTVLFRDGHAAFQAGGGVTALSDPELEYAETLSKAERIFRAFEGAPG